jgi:hypothetical protein
MGARYYCYVGDYLVMGMMGARAIFARPSAA